MSTYEGVVLEALADPTRRSIFELLADGPRSVAMITDHVPVSRPAVSQHLRVLKEARLVQSAPRGTRRIYALDPTGLTAVREYFQRFWTAGLAAYATAVEQSTQEDE